MRITSKGQVTIPKDIRDRTGMQPGTEIDFVINGDRVWVRKRAAQEGSEDERVRKFRSHLARFRGTGTSGLTTDEIMEMTRGPYDDIDSR